VFRIDKSGTGFKVLKDFDVSFPNPGRSPCGALLQRADGRLYGTLQYGGIYDDGAAVGHGSTFRLKPDGTAFEFICKLDGPTTGSMPTTGLIEAATDTFMETPLAEVMPT
jgi:hypothetical protein